MLLAAACRVGNPVVNFVQTIIAGSIRHVRRLRAVAVKLAHRVPCVFEESALLCRVPRCDRCAGSKGACAIWRHCQRSQWMVARLKAADDAAIGRVQPHQLPVRPSNIQSASCRCPCHCPHAPVWHAGTTSSTVDAAQGSARRPAANPLAFSMCMQAASGWFSQILTPR